MSWVSGGQLKSRLGSVWAIHGMPCCEIHDSTNARRSRGFMPRAFVSLEQRFRDFHGVKDPTDFAFDNVFESHLIQRFNMFGACFCKKHYQQPRTEDRLNPPQKGLRKISCLVDISGQCGPRCQRVLRRNVWSSRSRTCERRKC